MASDLYRLASHVFGVGKRGALCCLLVIAMICGDPFYKVASFLGLTSLLLIGSKFK
jgi:hypothetical protein